MTCDGTGRWLEACGVTLRCNRFMFPCEACGWKGLSQADLDKMDERLGEQTREPVGEKL